MRGFAKVTRDLSERRQSEERTRQLNKELRARVAELTESQRIVELRTLELQKMSGRLSSLQDEERRKMARELHDDLGQELALLIPSAICCWDALGCVFSIPQPIASQGFILNPLKPS